ncbi:unnamed protein product, partial [Mesorhabditis spiculigera]
MGDYGRGEMDYYGDYSGYATQPRAYPSAPPMRSNGHVRNSPTKSYDNGHSNYLCLFATGLAIRAVFVVFIIGSLYYIIVPDHLGSQQNFLVALGAFECLTMISILMMYCALNRHNPYLCVPYVVMRTVEFFLWGVIIYALFLAVRNPTGEYFEAVYKYVRLAAEYLHLTNTTLNLRDLTLTLCWCAGFFSLAALGVAAEAMRHAWVITAKVTDARRRYCRSADSDTRRIMIASDEFNYA